MSQHSVVPRRVAGVTVGLASTGAVLGAGISAAVGGFLGAGYALLGNTAISSAPVPVLAGLGAVLGAVLTPLTAFSLLRRVALGKTLLGTMLGMALGSSAGLAVSGGDWLVAAGSGVAGFLVAAVLLRLFGSTRGKEPDGKGV